MIDGGQKTWVDGFGRTARKLRISITDRCNLRCMYCMPEDPEWLPKSDLLTYEELVRVASIAVDHGVEAVRITGGEPLVRRDVPAFVKMLRGIDGLKQINLTTNAMYLSDHAGALKSAGLDRINVSLDTLDADRFQQLARRDGLQETLAGMDAADAAGFGPLRVNCVVMRGINDHEIVPLLNWGREHGREVRFIEFMPLEGDRIWNRDLVFTSDEILQLAAAEFSFEPVPNQDLREPARRYAFDDGGSFGIIASVTRAFCASCDRIRVTADGGFRTCLFATEATDLRGPVRNGATDEEIAALMSGAVLAKWAGHSIDATDFERPDRPMNAIGG